MSTTSPIAGVRISKESGEMFETYPYIIQGLCDRCCLIVCRVIFDKSLVKQVRDKIKEGAEE